MDFLREVKISNLIYGMMIFLTVSLFFFSGRNDHANSLIFPSKNDTQNALEGLIHEKNEDTNFTIDLKKSVITPQLIDEMIQREENEKQLCLAENREHYKQIMHNIQSLFMVIFIAILTFLYIYSSYPLKKKNKNMMRRNTTNYKNDEYEEDHFNSYHLLSTMEI